MPSLNEMSTCLESTYFKKGAQCAFFHICPWKVFAYSQDFLQPVTLQKGIIA